MRNSDKKWGVGVCGGGGAERVYLDGNSMRRKGTA